ncbi:hypothetical protein HDF16_005396 [Granulicella aggregans]|uniref:Uncharacterized protein n=1 Tax=Granulicella aggregans TaxID=474949 RepID=A0A7W7ZIN8_9BACT|nr:hypothetical protein [Granulicella aggregans]
MRDNPGRVTPMEILAPASSASLPSLFTAQPEVRKAL